MAAFGAEYAEEIGALLFVFYLGEHFGVGLSGCLLVQDEGWVAVGERTEPLEDPVEVFLGGYRFTAMLADDHLEVLFGE